MPIAGTCERVWDALTDPALLAGLDLDVELASGDERLTVGSTVQLRTADGQILHRVVAAQPASRLVLHGLLRDCTSRDEIRIEPLGSRVLVRWHLAVEGDDVTPGVVALSSTLQRLVGNLAFPRAPDPPKGEKRFRRATA